jgi:O-antigen/teichoic acid export membrane protein
MLFCSYVTTVSNAVVVAHHREQRVMYITALGLLINVTSNLFLIPRWGAVGAAIAILSSEGAIFLAMLYQTGRCRPEIRMGALFGRPLAAAAAALFPIYALRDWNLFLGGAAAGIVYAIALVITRAIPSADRQLALSLFQRRRELP